MSQLRFGSPVNIFSQDSFLLREDAIQGKIEVSVLKRLLVLPSPSTLPTLQTLTEVNHSYILGLRCEPSLNV